MDSVLRNFYDLVQTEHGPALFPFLSRFMAIAIRQKYHQLLFRIFILCPSIGVTGRSNDMFSTGGNRCGIIQPQRTQISQSTLLRGWGGTGGFQRINGVLESWRNRITHCEGIKEQRALCLNSSWAGGKDVSKSWGLLKGTTKVFVKIWLVEANMERLSGTPGEIPE